VLPARRAQAEPDPLFLLAGGPGQAASAMAPLVDRFFREVRERRDVVLVDLRGTGDSHPLACAPPADELDALGAKAAFELDVAACLARQDADPRLYTSEQQMADLDEVRARLGYERINLWGGSFGTRAALVYARLFPARVRSVVLDGAAPLEFEFPLSLARDNQRALDRLLADCAAEAACAAAFPRLGQELAELLARLEREPARVSLRHPRTGEPVELALGRDRFAGGLRVFLYSASHQALMPLLIDQAWRGNFAPFVALSLAGMAWSVDTMALGLTLSVVCAEDVAGVTDEEIAAASRGSFLGRSEMDEWKRWCSLWPAGTLSPGLRRAPPSAAPALILSGELDPVTPPRWGEVMARHFHAARQVVAPGTGHNVSFSGCVPDVIARFLAAGSAAGLDTSCVAALRRPPFVLDLAGSAP
jgi:pimeloyl-ACP methyl ester carboxylesterase